MKNLKLKHKRFGAIFLCLALLCGTIMGTMGWTLAAADKDVFAVDFADLAALVDDDGGIFADGLYKSEADDANINAWMDARFSMYYNRENDPSRSSVRTYLGQQKDTGSEHPACWNITSDGKLQGGMPISAYADYVRTADSLTLKYEGEDAVLDNFEAKVVFSIPVNYRGAVYLSFNEKDPGRFGWRNDFSNTSPIDNDAVIVALPESITTDAGRAGVQVKGYGEAYVAASSNYSDMLDDAFSSVMELNVNYELYVKVLDNDVTVKVTKVSDGTTLLSKTYTDAVKGTTGTVSVGVAQSYRAIKSIEVKELDANGKQVDFGTLSDEGLPAKFDVDFEDLAALVDDDGGSFDATTGLYTSAADDTNINAWINERFSMHLSRENRIHEERTYLGEVKNVDSGEGSFWRIAQNGYLQLSVPGGGEYLRTTEALTLKYNNALAVLDNFEAKVVFRYTADRRSAVFVSFNETLPGKMGWSTSAAEYIKQDAVLFVTGEEKTTQAGQSGIVTKGVGDPLTVVVGDFSQTGGTAFTDALALNTDYEMTVRVIGSNVTVRVVNVASGKEMLNETYVNAVKGDTGYVSIGAGHSARAIRSIEVKELDAAGNWVDFGTYTESLNPPVTVQQFDVDFAALAALVPTTSFVDGVYTPAETDTAINEWIAERFDGYYNRENWAYTTRKWLGEQMDTGNANYPSYWSITSDGALKSSIPTQLGGEYARTTESLNVQYKGQAAILDNFEAKVVFSSIDCRGAVYVSFNEASPGKFSRGVRNDLNEAVAADYNQQDAVLVGTPEHMTHGSNFSGVTVKGVGESFDTFAMEDDKFTLTADTDYELTVKVIGSDVTVKLVKVSDGTILLNKKFVGAAKGTSGFLSIGAGQSSRSIKSIVITELDKNGTPVDFGTFTDEANRPAYFKADFSELSALVADTAFVNGEYTPAETDTAINEWIAAKFDGYYNRECWNYTARTWLGDKLDTGNANYPSYWSITEGGALKSSIPGWLGGQYPRTTESLNVKYDGAAAKLDNFKAKVVFSTISERGAVYVSFNETTPGKFGWTLNPTNNQDNSYILQDAVIIGTPENLTHVSNFSGVTVKGYSETFNEYGMEDDKFTLTADTDYELTVTVIDNDVAVKLKKVSDGTIVHEKTYTDQVLGTDGYVSIGAGQTSRSIKYIEVAELNGQGEEVAFGTYSSTTKDSDGFYVDFKALAAVVDSADYVNGMYQSKADDIDINAWIASRFGLFYSRESWGFHDRAYLGQLSSELDGGDGFGGNHYWEINKTGYLQHTTEKTGGEYLRKGDALYIKHNDIAVELDNFEATLEFNTMANGKGSVYIAFHEAQAGKFGWYTNPTNTADTSPMMQDAVILGVDGEGDTGIVVKKSGVAISGTDMSEDTFTMSANTDYKLNIRVLGKDVEVKVSKGNTTVFTKTYTNAVTDNAGFISFGTTNATRSFKSIEVIQLDDDGNVVEFGTSLLDPVNPDDTVRYTFSSADELDDFTSYHLSVPGVDENGVLTEGTANDNWYIKNATLQYQQTSLYKDETAINAVSGNPWNSNMAVAMLNTGTYENFILETDFYVNGRWAVFGFGAKGDVDGMFSSQKDGGYTIHIEAGAGKGEVKLTGWDTETENSKMLFNTFLTPYSGNGKHHMRLIVHDGTVTVYLDDIAPVTIDLPESYEDGYIYLGSNTAVTYYDNLTVTDLDKGPFVITSLKKGMTDSVTLNRDQGDIMDLDAMPNIVTGYDADGYVYTFPAEWLNADYRSYKDGTFDFTLNPTMDMFKLDSSLNAVKQITNNINDDFDTETTVKYYFDHTNDFLDFVTGYDDTSMGGHSTSDEGRFAIASSPTEKWKLTGTGAVTNNYKSQGYGHNSDTIGWDLSTLMQKELNLTNYRLELDFTHGDNFWYPYVITGVQDFSAYKGDDGGVYFFMEQEGRPNINNNLRNGSKQYTTPITEDNTFFKSYDRSVTTKHHVTIEVVDGVLTFWVDDSDGYPHYISETALGGYIGIGGMGNGTTFSGITITALDEDGNEVPLDEADRSMASDIASYEDTFVGWKPSSDAWTFEWNKNYIFEF